MPSNPIANRDPNCVCKQCQTPFFAFPTYLRRGGGQFCTADCCWQFKRANRKPENRNTLPLPCSVCGELVARRPRALGRNVFCSQHRYPDAAQTFWARAEKSEGCWNWTGSKGSTGYGQISDRGKNINAHRFSWELHHGPIEDGQWVLHKCDNRACVNPDHLFLGTLQDNYRDMVQKGRHPSTANPGIRGGENAPNHLLTAEQARQIRLRANLGEPHLKLAREFNVDRSVISKIKHRKAWKHI